MWFDRKFDVTRTTVRPALPFASPPLRPDFAFSARKSTSFTEMITFVCRTATAQIQHTAGGSYGYKFRAD